MPCTFPTTSSSHTFSKASGEGKKKKKGGEEDCCTFFVPLLPRLQENSAYRDPAPLDFQVLMPPAPQLSRQTF